MWRGIYIIYELRRRYRNHLIIGKYVLPQFATVSYLFSSVYSPTLFSHLSRSLLHISLAVSFNFCHLFLSLSNMIDEYFHSTLFILFTFFISAKP